MPARGYRSISIREDLYQELVSLQNELKMVSLNDVIAFLLEPRSSAGENLSPKIQDLEERLSFLERKFEEILSSLEKAQVAQAAPKEVKKRDLVDVLKEQKWVSVNKLKLRKPEAFIAKAEKSGAEVFEGPTDTIIVDKEFLADFKLKLESVKSTMSEEEKKKLLGEEGYSLLQALKEQGLVYADALDEHKYKFA
ncbi:MAG: hypothetical protein DRO09_00035 [Thermoprotei archaeon]|nr:MAG: hypothetical protein DRO09_00035 [Thermoprotei archaeon]